MSACILHRVNYILQWEVGFVNKCLKVVKVFIKAFIALIFVVRPQPTWDAPDMWGSHFPGNLGNSVNRAL